MPSVRSKAQQRPDTRRRLLDAAVDVLAEDGMGAFTHRVIEQRAAVYHGATTHFFGTRDQLIDAVFEHLFALDHGRLDSHYDVPTNPAALTDPDAVRRMLRGGVGALFDSRREAIARYQLVVHAAQQPRLQESLGRWRGSVVAQATPVFAALGASDPERSARLFVAGADGLLLHAFSAPWPQLEADLDGLVDGLVAGALSLAQAGATCAR